MRFLADLALFVEVANTGNFISALCKSRRRAHQQGISPQRPECRCRARSVQGQLGRFTDDVRLVSGLTLRKFRGIEFRRRHIP